MVDEEPSSFRDSVTFFMLVTCGFSWAIWLPVIASQRGWIDAELSPSPWGSFGPAIGALVVMGANRRLGELRGRFRLRGVAARYWLIALGVPLAALVLAVVLTFLFSRPSPEVILPDNLFLAPVLFIAILVLGGPLGEEPGWRGYLLPKLLGRCTPLGASLRLAVLWTLWHVPLFWMEGAEQEGGSVVLFFVVVVDSAIVFTWIFLTTDGNLWIAILLHASINFGSYGLGMLIPTLEDDTVYPVAVVVIASAFALTIVGSWLRRAPSVE